MNCLLSIYSFIDPKTGIHWTVFSLHPLLFLGYFRICLFTNLCAVSAGIIMSPWTLGTRPSLTSWTSTPAATSAGCSATPPAKAATRCNTPQCYILLPNCLSCTGNSTTVFKFIAFLSATRFSPRIGLSSVLKYHVPTLTYISNLRLWSFPSKHNNNIVIFSCLVCIKSHWLSLSTTYIILVPDLVWNAGLGFFLSPRFCDWFSSWLLL